MPSQNCYHDLEGKFHNGLLANLVKYFYANYSFKPNHWLIDFRLAYWLTKTIKLKYRRYNLGTSGKDWNYEFGRDKNVAKNPIMAP